MDDLKKLFQFRIVRRIVYACCGLALLLVSLVAWRICWFNQTEQKLVGNWLMVKVNGEDFPGGLCLGFSKGRRYGQLDPYTVKMKTTYSETVTFWFANGEKFSVFMMPRYFEETDEFLYNVFRYSVKREKHRSGLRIVSVTDDELLLQNVKNSKIATFRRVSKAEFPQIAKRFLTEQKKRQAKKVSATQHESRQ